MLAVQFPALAFRPQLAQPFGAALRTASHLLLDLILARCHVHSAEWHDPTAALRRFLQEIVVVSRAQLVLPPREAERDADVDARFVHAREEVFGRRDLRLRAGVHFGECGVALDELLAPVADLQRKDVRMEVDDHGRILTPGRGPRGDRKARLSGLTY